MGQGQQGKPDLCTGRGHVHTWREKERASERESPLTKFAADFLTLLKVVSGTENIPGRQNLGVDLNVAHFYALLFIYF